MSLSETTTNRIMGNNVRTLEQRELEGLHLFKALIKDGCVWRGDVLSSKWSECLYFDDSIRDAVMETLWASDEGVDYKLEDGAVWIY